MKDEFTPPIRSRSTDELLKVVSDPGKWQVEAVYLAQVELEKRQVPSELIAKKKKNVVLREKFNSLAKAKASYGNLNPLSYVFSPINTLLSIIFATGLEKDGYTQMAKERKKVLKVLTVLIALTIAAIMFVIIVTRS